MMKIAVIDDGISSNKIKNLEFNIEIDKNYRIIENYDNAQDNSHGTTCAMIIKKYSPEALLGSIKILQTYTKRGYVDQFKKSLEWCIQNDISLINLSLGSTKSYDSSILHECTENAYKNGIIIVAALSNKYVVTYPASFQHVIGVITDPLLVDNMFYIKQSCIEGADVVASSIHNIENTITNTCNSFAAPLITAKVDRILNEYEYKKIEYIKSALNNISYKKLENYNPNRKLKRRVSIENKNSEPIDIPCVIVKYRNSDDNTIHLLNSMFNQNEYSTLCILTNGCDTLNNLHIVNVDQLDDHVLEYFVSKYDADIVLIGIDDTSNIKNITCDLLFFHESGDNLTTNDIENFKSNRNISCEINIAYQNGSNLIEYIYKKTVELLE